MIHLLFRNLVKNQTVSLQDDEKVLLNFLGIDSSSTSFKGLNSLKVSTVYAIFRILTDSVGKLPIKLYKNNKKLGGHYLYRLFKLRPNPFMSAIDFWKTIEFQTSFTGNGYANIDFHPTTGQVRGLYPIDSSKVTPYVDVQGFRTKKMWYIVQCPNGEERKVPSDEMLHFKGLTHNGLVGINPFDYLKCVVENVGNAQEYINKYYKSGMQSKGLIQYVGNLDEKAENLFKEKFERMANGLKNAHRVSLLPLGYQYQAISQKLVDSQFVENNNLSIREIASCWGVKLHQLNNLEKASYSSLVEVEKEFYLETLQPKLTSYEQEVTYKCLRSDEIESGHYFKFNVDAILRSDVEKRFNSYHKAVQNGIFTSNEIRQMEDKTPMDGGDRLLINGNMIPIAMAGEQYKKGGEK